HRLIDAGLIGAKGTAALQHQRDLVAIVRPPAGGGGPRFGQLGCRPKARENDLWRYGLHGKVLSATPKTRRCMGIVRRRQASGRIMAASSVAWTDRHNFKKLSGPGSLG